MARGNGQRGFTLIELLVVVVIIAVASGVVILGFGATDRAKLRSSAWTLAAAARFAYSRAVTRGTTTRLVLDFDKRTLHVEETRGRVVLNPDDETGSGLRREGDEEYLSDAGVENASLSTKLDAIGQGIGAIGSGLGPTTGGGVGQGSPLDLLGGAGGADPLAGMMQGLSTGALSDPFLSSLQGAGGGRPTRYLGARFQPIEGRRGEKRELEGNTAFLRAFTPHEPRPREGGKAFVYFFPNGTTEHSVIQLSDGDERIYSVEIHPLSGRAVIHPFELEPDADLDLLQEAEE
jgi:prepilin-type N-terminal cleavage/methylation domain-containing protein